MAELGKITLNVEIIKGKCDPQIIGIFAYKNHEGDKPDKIRLTFADGSTAVYDIHVQQPEPVFVEIRNRQGYVNQPMRRRRRG